LVKKGFQVNRKEIMTPKGVGQSPEKEASVRGLWTGQNDDETKGGRRNGSFPEKGALLVAIETLPKNKERRRGTAKEKGQRSNFALKGKG